MNPFTYNSAQPSSGGGDTRLQQLAKTDRNPIQESEYQSLLAQQNGSGASNSNPLVQQAQQLNDFYKTANQPVVAALGTQSTGLDQKYTDLVNSIKGNQTVASNAQTLATNNQLGARGINPASGIYQNEMNSALLPVNAAYSGQLAQANAGSIADQQSLALQIAQLQAGNPEASVGNALSYGGLVNSTNQLAQQGFLGTYQSPNTQAQTAYQLALANSLNGGNVSALDSLRTQLGG